MRILVTGGAGFIGSHLVDRLISEGHDVCSFDNLDPQIHGPGQIWPAYQPEMPDGPLRVIGDVCDDNDLRLVLERFQPTIVVHLAAKVGVGQSALNPRDYTLVNAGGTASLLQALQEYGKCQRLVVASSMSAYGEGMYYRAPHLLRGILRSRDHMLQASTGNASWEPAQHHPRSSIPIAPLGTPTGIAESEPFQPESIYAETKATTERMALIWGQQHGIPTAAMRFFNVFGARQSPRNPYTGVVATFLSAALRGEDIRVYEDGRQTRDFIDVRTVARVVANMATVYVKEIGPFNVGRGVPTTIGEIARHCNNAAGVVSGRWGTVKITGEFRSGDVRHCLADPSRLRALGRDMNPEPQEGEDPLLDDGILHVAKWMVSEELTPIGNPHAEMKAAGLVFGHGGL